MLREDPDTEQQIMALYTYYIRCGQILAEAWTTIIIAGRFRSKNTFRYVLLDRFIPIALTDICRTFVYQTHLIPWNTKIADLMPNAMVLLSIDVLSMYARDNSGNHSLKCYIEKPSHFEYFSNIINAVIMVIYCLNKAQFLEEHEGCGITWAYDEDADAKENVGRMLERQYHDRPSKYKEHFSIDVDYKGFSFTLLSLVEDVFLKSGKTNLVDDNLRKEMDKELKEFRMEDFFNTLNKIQGKSVADGKFYEKEFEKHIKVDADGDESKVWVRTPPKVTKTPKKGEGENQDGKEKVTKKGSTQTKPKRKKANNQEDTKAEANDAPEESPADPDVMECESNDEAPGFEATKRRSVRKPLKKSRKDKSGSKSPPLVEDDVGDWNQEISTSSPNSATNDPGETAEKQSQNHRETIHQKKERMVSTRFVSGGDQTRESPINIDRLLEVGYCHQKLDGQSGILLWIPRELNVDSDAPNQPIFRDDEHFEFESQNHLPMDLLKEFVEKCFTLSYPLVKKVIFQIFQQSGHIFTCPGKVDGRRSITESDITDGMVNHTVEKIRLNCITTDNTNYLYEAARMHLQHADMGISLMDEDCLSSCVKKIAPCLIDNHDALAMAVHAVFDKYCELVEKALREKNSQPEQPGEDSGKEDKSDPDLDGNTKPDGEGGGPSQDDRSEDESERKDEQGRDDKSSSEREQQSNNSSNNTKEDGDIDSTGCDDPMEVATTAKLQSGSSKNVKNPILIPSNKRKIMGKRQHLV